eukprot:1921771-Alexandrium_andersonii.AAC.1
MEHSLVCLQPLQGGELLLAGLALKRELTLLRTLAGGGGLRIRKVGVLKGAGAHRKQSTTNNSGRASKQTNSIGPVSRRPVPLGASNELAPPAWELNNHGEPLFKMRTRRAKLFKRLAALLMKDAETVNNGMPPITHLFTPLQEPGELRGATRENTTQPQQAKLDYPAVNGGDM